MTGRRAVGILAIAVLGVGTIVSVATATRPCGRTACSDEVAAACSGLSGRAFRRLYRESGFDEIRQRRRRGPLPFLMTVGRAVKLS